MTFSGFGGLADYVILSGGWQRNLIALVSGAIGVLALPPFGVFPLLIIPMTVSVWLLDGVTGQGKKQSRFSAQWEAAKVGWWLGFGYFLAGLWWLGAAFLVEADEFAWALPLGVMGLPAVLAVFTAIGFAVSRSLWADNSARILALAVGLGFSEWLRSVVLTGFPWNNLGMALGANHLLAQVASIVGIHGLTVLSVGIAAAPALLADRSSRRLPLGLATVSFALLAGFGLLRLSGDRPGHDPLVQMRIMQPNLPQDDKFRPDAMPQVLARYLALSGQATASRPNGLRDVTHLIWPESPFPVIISRDSSSLQQIGDFLSPQATLITGAAREESARGSEGRKFFNSIQVMRPGGVIVDTYDKVHLVPFGEYLPLRRVFDSLGLRQFVHVPGGFEPGALRQVLRAPGFPLAAPLICYEAIFPGAVTPPAPSERPAVLLNVTNDGWFGDTPGPRQHFAQARLRAIEEGLPLVRAANTGVSAVVDAYGRVLELLPVGVEGVIDAPLPLPAEPTVFSRHPFLAPFALWALTLGLALWIRRPGPRRRHG